MAQLQDIAESKENHEGLVMIGCQCTSLHWY